jgi:hypothetical protein
METKGTIMDRLAKDAAILAVYQAAREALLNAAAVADQAVQAIMAGNVNLAVGTAMEAQTDAVLACKMFDAAVALHRAKQE